MHKPGDDDKTRKQLIGELARLRRQLAATLHLIESLDDEEVLKRIARAARELLTAYDCAIYLLDMDGAILNPVVAVTPLYEEEILSTPLEVDASLTGQAVKARRGMIFNDAETASSGSHIPGTPVEEDEHIIVAPLIAGDEILGAMCLSRFDTTFTDEDLNLAETFAAYAAAALRNAQTHRDLRREVEERKHAEEELQRAQKLESVGILAGGIAHDFNNLLTGILGNITLAKVFNRGNPEAIDILNQAEQASLQARDLTQQLLTFAKGGSPIRKTVSISSLLKDCVEFALRGSTVGHAFVIPEDIWPVNVDEGQFGQAVQNVVLNADQAMLAGGTLVVRAENVTFGPAQALPLSEGRYVKISIQDQGTGIPAEHLLDIFDPYFTTKQEGRGLGLATAYSIVKAHDGHITVESELGAGSAFHIYVPASSETSVEKPTGSDWPADSRSARVLLMDDQEMVREIGGRMLVHLGYEVEFAVDGADAIQMYCDAMETGNPFDVVIFDLTVPGGMGGVAAIEKLRGIDPEIKAIVCSGYSTDPVMAEYEAYGFQAVIAKPYQLADLQAAVVALLADV